MPNPLPRPSRANRAIPAAGCVAALALAAVWQLSRAGDPTDLPAPGNSAVQVQALVPTVSGGEGAAGALSTDIFDPARTRGTGAGPASVPAGPLGTSALVGSIRLGARAYAVVQNGDGSITRLPVGSSFKGLRLLAITNDGAMFAQGGRRISVPFGPSPIIGRPDVQAAPEEDQQ